jgi:ubiquinol-cytochrome c reductase iron-sulfur subunit
MNRRSFLYSTTTVVAGVGLAAAMWPFIDQMDPDAAVKAATEFPQYDLTGLRPRQLLTVRWRDIPVFVAVRTHAMLAAMQESAFVAQLVDPDSRESRQPAFAENFHRSSDPALAVLVGICPSCRCIPQYIAETSALGVVGGYACPCCATRYDPAGRAYYGLARFNLAVPPYDIVDGATLLVGKGGEGDSFSIDSFERSS